MATTDQDVAKLQARIEALEGVCAEASQHAGVVGAPARVLDVLWAAAEGLDFSGTTFLPLALEECREIAERDEKLRRVKAVLDDTSIGVE